MELRKFSKFFFSPLSLFYSLLIREISLRSTLQTIVYTRTKLKEKIKMILTKYYAIIFYLFIEKSESFM